MRIHYIIILFCLSCVKHTSKNADPIHKIINKYNDKYKEYQRVNVDSARLYADSIFTISTRTNYTNGIGLAYLNYGLLEQIKASYDAAIHINQKALKIFTEINNDTLIAKCCDALGLNYWQKGQNDIALQYLFRSLKINENLNIPTEIAANYNHISMVYQSQNKIKLAEEFANKSMNIVKKLKTNYSNISVFHNLANIYGMQGKYEEAMYLDSIGLSWCEQLNVEFNKSMFYDNLANCFYFIGKVEQAIQYHIKAIAVDSSFKNNKQLGDTYSNLGYIYEEKNEFNKAIDYYQKSLDLCRTTGYKIGVKNALEQLSALHFKMNNAPEAYKYLKESTIVKDSIINTASEEKIAELQTLFDTEKKKQEIEQQALKISRRNILLIAFLIIFILSFIAFNSFYKRKKVEQERKLQEELVKEEEKRSKAIIESEENERQRLARELHDGVGQLLSATKLNLNTLVHNNVNDDNNVLQNSLEILDDSIKEIRNISHNMVPDVLLKFGLKKAIEDFTNRINQSKKIHIDFECNSFDEKYLNDASKLMLYRIVQESVNNTIKYAEATQLNIQLSADETEISLLMEDNGKGFDVKEALEKGGIGLKNMQLRTNYLKGKLVIDSSPKNGTTIIIEIPLS